MKHFRLIAAMLVGASLSACASVDTATRNAPLTLAPEATEATAPAPTSVDVVAVNVSVPEHLQVSEANRYYPGGDIVWREDPLGDRHEQVKAIFDAAMQNGVKDINGDVPVVLDVEVTRFHALTEKARYTTGGVHALQFKMQLRDAKTGETIGEPKMIKADFKAFGGARAINAERNGITQKLRITSRLSQVIRDELTQPDGYVAFNNGWIGALNQI